MKYILSFQTINKFSYKIYEYTPSCNNMTTTKKVYIHIWKNEFIYLRLYRYSDVSKIQQNSEGYFINFDSEIRLSDYLSEIDFECGKTYYLVFKHSYNSEIFRPFYCQFSFSDDILNTIDISSLFLKSRYLAFLKRTTKEEKYLYSSNEDKYLLISFRQGSNLSIIDDNNQTIYEVKADKYMTKVLEFKSGQNYIINYIVKSNSTINFHIYNESDIFKHDFNDIPMFARILQEFLSTVGITANFGEPQENEIIATIERGKTVDKKMIMDNFKDVLENVEIADFTKG